jgi:hypothetical protein
MESDSKANQTSAEVRNKVHDIYMGILSDIRVATPKDNGDEEQKAYEGEFQRTLFTADALIWFRTNGQYMHPAAQKLYIDLAQSFQSESPQNARHTQIRIQEIQNKEELFKELFLNQGEFERGKFTYSCLEWFKQRGQYLPGDVQLVFLNWLGQYQRTNSTDGQFMQQRLQWMMDHNDLYQDFLNIGES